MSLYERVGPYEWSLSYPSFQDVARESRAFGSMAAWRNGGGVVSAPGDADHVAGRQISAGLFALLGAPLLAGREFSAQEDRVGGNPVAVIGQRLWRRRFKENPGVIGRALVLDGRSYTVVGVAAAGFGLGDDSDVYIPLGQDASESMRNRQMRKTMNVLARLRPGVSLEQARLELGSIARTVVERQPEVGKAFTFTAVPLRQEIVSGVKPTLELLLGAVVLVLLIGCANLATLLLVRAAAREREVAMRIALGAGRGRLIRQCVTESSVIALLGGALGIGLAAIGVRPFLAIWPGALPRAEEIQLDWRVFMFALAVSLVSSLLFGLAPAMRAPIRHVERALRTGNRATAGPRRLHGAFVASEIAITTVLLVSAGMMGREVLRLSRLDPGINPDNLLTAQVSLSPGVTVDSARIRGAWQDILERVRRIPGVTSVAATDIVPMSGGSDEVGYTTDSAQPTRERMPMALLYAISPDYLKTMGMTLRAGRFISEYDRLGGEPVAVVDEMLAQQSFRGQAPLGRSLNFGLTGPVRVIGVVAHVKHWGVAQDDSHDVRGQIYFPFAQIPDRFVGVMSSGLSIVVRTSVPPMSLVPAVQREVRGWTNDQAVYNVQTMETIMGGTMAQHRFLLLQFGIFAGLALMLAGIGIYGVVAHLTGMRMQEFGVRMALGATGGDVVGLALGQVVWMVALGVAVGSTASFAAARALTAATGASAKDPWTFALMTALLVATALVAGFVPAWRAGSADPVRILRQE